MLYLFYVRRFAVLYNKDIQKVSNNNLLEKTILEMISSKKLSIFACYKKHSNAGKYRRYNKEI